MARWETKGDKTLRKAGAPSNKGKLEAVQCETKEDTTSGKADTPSNTKADIFRNHSEPLTVYCFGKQEGAQRKSRPSREGGQTIQERQTHHPRRGTKGVKTLEKAVTPGVQWESRPLGRRNPHITLFGEKTQLLYFERSPPWHFKAYILSILTSVLTYILTF